MNSEKLHKALGIFLEEMRNFLVQFIEKHYPNEDWFEVFYERLGEAQQNSWELTLQSKDKERKEDFDIKNCIDYNNLTYLSSKFRDELMQDSYSKSATYQLGNCLTELKDVRNSCQHFNPLSEDDIDRAFSNMILVANMFKLNELRDEIKRIEKQTSIMPVVTSESPETLEVINVSKDISEDSKPLPSWFNNCLPHYDIRNSKLDESVFAANLNEVSLGTGPEVYSNPTTFFSKTYITAGLRDIANRVIKALNGEETENRVISLQTGFGGGKNRQKSF